MMTTLTSLSQMVPMCRLYSRAQLFCKKSNKVGNDANTSRGRSKKSCDDNTANKTLA